MQKHSVKIDDKTIDYTLKRKERKRLRINVLPDLSVEVIAPTSIPLEDVFYKVRKRAFWILKQRRYFEQFHPIEPEKEYVSGETHKYLGRQYRLKAVESTKNNVKLKGKYFYVYVKDKSDSGKVEELLYRWYRKKAKKKFAEIIEEYLPKLKKYGISEPTLTVRKMKSRWGSCNSKSKRIILNLELIKTPSHCVEYVIMHELCHLKYPNHTKAFYNFLSMVMPDWKERKQRLEKAGALAL